MHFVTTYKEGMCVSLVAGKNGAWGQVVVGEAFVNSCHHLVYVFSSL